MKELHDRGSFDPLQSNRNLCKMHIDDQYLERRLDPYLDTSEPLCDYCGVSDSAGTFTVESLTEVVKDAIGYRYLLAAEAPLPPRDDDSSDPFGGAPTLETDEVVEQICWPSISDENIRTTITAHIGSEEWIDYSYPWNTPSQQLKLGWQDFAQHVRHKGRFAFLMSDEAEQWNPDAVPVKGFMNEVAQVMRDSHLVGQMAQGETFYRGRLFPEARRLDTPPGEYLGPPPPDSASASRMSPAGISMFYGSRNIETVVAEIGFHSLAQYAHIVAFKTLRETKVIDLTELPEFTSYFDPEMAVIMDVLPFLRGFARDIAAPLSHAGLDIGYAPTQVLTEYLRFINPGCEGILFNSAQDPEGVNCALFIGPDAVAHCSSSTVGKTLIADESTFQVQKVVARGVPVADSA